LESKKYVLDRFEGSFAVLEDIETRENISIDMEHIPPGADAGDVMLKTDDGFMVDRAATEERKKRVDSLFNKIKRNV